MKTTSSLIGFGLLAGATAFTFAAVKAVAGMVGDLEHKVDDLEARIVTLERKPKSLSELAELKDQSRFAALIIAVMDDAYRQIAAGGFAGAGRPWSRRCAARQILYSLKEHQPVGDVMAAKVRPWLEEHGVIHKFAVDDVVNLTRFPDLNSIQQLVYQAPCQAVYPGNPGKS